MIKESLPDVLEPVDELAARIPDRGADEVEQVLAFVVDPLERALIGQARNINALRQLGLVVSELSLYPYCSAQAVAHGIETPASALLEGRWRDVPGVADPRWTRLS